MTIPCDAKEDVWHVGGVRTPKKAFGGSHRVDGDGWAEGRGKKCFPNKHRTKLLWERVRVLHA